MNIYCATCTNQCECNLSKQVCCSDWFLSAGAMATTARYISRNNDISISDALTIICTCLKIGGEIE